MLEEAKTPERETLAVRLRIYIYSNWKKIANKTATMIPKKNFQLGWDKWE
jgi:hypothetical protein